ncbi:MAG: hypothetical protein QM742_19460 [Aquabacterium sp.]
MNTMATPASPLKPSINRWLAAGSMASLLSMLVLAWHGRRRHGSSTALINSPSHWVHGDRALRANAFSLRFTLLGALIHHLSSMFWAVLYEGVLSAWRKPQTPDSAPPAAQTPSAAGMVATASALTAVAWLVDTRLVPARLTPGFERRSSSTGMLMIYGAFAVGLAAGALMIQRKSRPDTPANAPAPRLYRVASGTESP